MSTKSQRAEAMHLVQEIEELRPRLEYYEEKVPHYKVARFSDRCFYGIKAMVSAALAIYCAITLINRYSQMPEVCIVFFAAATAFATVSAILMLVCCIVYSPEKRYTTIADSKRMDDLREVLKHYNDRLSQHDVMMAEAEKAFPEFENLRPVIEVEFNGAIDLIDTLKYIYWSITLPENRYGRTYFELSSTHDKYEELVMEIIAAREWKAQNSEAKTRRAAKVREFEKELTISTTDNSDSGNSDSPDSSN